IAFSIHERQIIGKLPWVLWLVVLILFPKALVHIAKFFALKWLHDTFVHTNHMLLGRCSVLPLNPASQELINIGGELGARFDGFVLTNDVIALGELQQFADDIARRNGIGISDKWINAAIDCNCVWILFY